MEPTSGQVMQEVLRLQDSLADVKGEALTAGDVRDAVANGLKAAFADPATWAAAVTAIQRHTQAEAGAWLFSGIKTLLSRLAWVCVIGVGVYLLGGWSALVSFFKSAIQ